MRWQLLGMQGVLMTSIYGELIQIFLDKKERIENGKNNNTRRDRKLKS